MGSQGPNASRRLSAVLGLLPGLLSGCVSGGELFVPLPQVEPGATLVLGVAGEHQGLRVFAREPSSPFLIPLEGERAELELLVYAERLEDLGLEGPELLPGASCRRSCSLLGDGVTRYTSAYQGGEIEAWSEGGAVSAGLQDFLLPDRAERCTPCASFDQEVLPLPTTLTEVKVVMAAREANGSVLVALREGGLFRIGSDYTVSVLCEPNLSGEARLWSGSLGQGVWLANQRGEVFRLDPELQDGSACKMERVRTSTIGAGGVRVVASSPLRAEDEAFLVTVDGELLRWQGVGFEQLGRFASSQPRRPLADAVIPGRAVFADGERQIASYVEGEMRVRTLSSVPSDDVIDALADSPELGIVVATSNNGFVLIDGDRVRTVGTDPWASAGAIVPYRGGLFFTGQSGDLVQYYPSLGFCPAIAGLTVERVFEATRLGEEDLILGDIITNESRATAVGLARLVRPDCR